MLCYALLHLRFVFGYVRQYAPSTNPRAPRQTRVFKFCTLNYFNVVIPSEVEESGKSA